MMDKISQLLIRACRTDDSITRLRSVYRRFYGRYSDYTETTAIAAILTELVDDVSPITVYEFLRRDAEYIMYDSIGKAYVGDKLAEVVTPRYLRVLYVMRDVLRHTPVKELHKLGYSRPCRFVNADKNKKN